MMVSGAVFTDRFISERLTDYIYMGPRAGRPGKLSPDDAAILEMAKLFQALNRCINTLTTYYNELQPAKTATASASGQNYGGPWTAQRRSARLGGNTPRSGRITPLVSLSPASFPFWNKFSAGGSSFTLAYSARLASSFPEKAVFKALMEKDGDGGEPAKEVVVKFTHSYGEAGHALLAAHSPPLAPALHFCEIVPEVGDLHVVVMDFVQPRSSINPQLDLASREALKVAVKTLHDKNLVFGDLRWPNIILPLAATVDDGRKQSAAMLIDFDWCGVEDCVRYPLNISGGRDMGWHKEVCGGVLIKKHHDTHMLESLW